MERITSRQNERYKTLKLLASNSKYRREQKMTILEGPHLCESYLNSGSEPRLVVVSDGGLANSEVAAILGKASGVEIINLPDDLFGLISVVENGIGLAFVVEVPDVASSPNLSRDALLLDAVQDPGNVGAILRTAAAAGVKDVYLSDGSAAAWSPKVLRAGMGAHFSMEIYENVNLSEVIENSTVPVFATSLEAEGSIYEKDLKQPVAWLFGNEGAGVSKELLELCETVIIPQDESVESLNVAASVAVCLFEQRRQRVL